MYGGGLYGTNGYGDDNNLNRNTNRDANANANANRDENQSRNRNKINSATDVTDKIYVGQILYLKNFIIIN